MTGGVGYAGGPEGSKPTRTSKSSRERRSPRASAIELDLDSILAVVGNLDDESEANVMGVARVAGLLAHASEFEAKELLLEIVTHKDELKDSDQHILAGLVAITAFSRICELNGPEAMRMLVSGELPEDPGADLATLGMNAWIAADPEGARRWYEGLLRDVDDLAMAGGKEAAMEGMLKLLKDDDLRESYYRGMARHDAEGMREQIDDLAFGELRDSVREEFLDALIEEEETAQGLVKILEEGGADGDGRLNAIAKLSRLDVVAARRLVEAEAPSLARDNEVTQVATILLKQDPEAGAEWFMGQEMVGDERPADRLQRIVGAWGPRDLEGADAWLSSQPSTTDRDHAEMLLATYSAGAKDWDRTFYWIGETDPETWSRQLDKVFKNAWDKTSGSLPPDVSEAAEAAGFGEAADNFAP